MAIGSYDATPLDMAGAYTIFANGGLHIDPWMLASVRTSTGDIIERLLARDTRRSSIRAWPISPPT